MVHSYSSFAYMYMLSIFSGATQSSVRQNRTFLRGKSTLIACYIIIIIIISDQFYMLLNFMLARMFRFLVYYVSDLDLLLAR